MTLLHRRPSGLSPAELAAHHVRTFIGERCLLGSTLVVPLGVLWREYRAWCEPHDWVPTAQELRSVLEAAPWADVVPRPFGRGRFRTIVVGVGVRPRV